MKPDAPITAIVAPVPRITLRVAEAAEALGISERFLTDLIARGEGPASFALGRVRLISVEALQTWARQRSEVLAVAS